jgi:hypothetical protein
MRIEQVAKEGEDEQRGEGPKGKLFMVPSLLPEECPADDLAREWPEVRGDDITEFGRVYDLGDFVPIGLFARLIVRVLHIPELKLVLAWRSGLLVELTRAEEGGGGAPVVERALIRQHSKPTYSFELLVRTNSSTVIRGGGGGPPEEEEGKGKSAMSADARGNLLASSLLRIKSISLWRIIENEGVLPTPRRRSRARVASTHSQNSSSEDTGEAAAPDDTSPRLSSSSSSGSSGSAVSSSSPSASASLRQSSEDEVLQVDLLDHLVYVLDVLFQGYVGLEVKKRVVCLAIDQKKGHKVCRHAFDYTECIEAMMGSRPLRCSAHRGAPVTIGRLAPDLAMGSVRLIGEDELRKHNRVGKGGFGEVYRATWNNSTVALKLLMVRSLLV